MSRKVAMMGSGEIKSCSSIAQTHSKNIKTKGNLMAETKNVKKDSYNSLKGNSECFERYKYLNDMFKHYAEVLNKDADDLLKIKDAFTEIDDSLKRAMGDFKLGRK